MTSDQNAKGTVQIALRISPQLRERIKSAAETNNRSVNSELTATLEEAYPEPVPQDVLDALEKLTSVIQGFQAHPKATPEVSQKLDPALQTLEGLRKTLSTSPTEKEQQEAAQILMMFAQELRDAVAPPEDT